jgi:uncharacterized integral membrane protein
MSHGAIATNVHRKQYFDNQKNIKNEVFLLVSGLLVFSFLNIFIYPNTPPTSTPYNNIVPSQPLGKIGISFNLVFIVRPADATKT